MSDVKRYKIGDGYATNYNPPCPLEPASDGELVYFADHERAGKEMRTERDSLAWLVTHYEIVYDPGVATQEDKASADRIFKRACEISPPSWTT